MTRPASLFVIAAAASVLATPARGGDRAPTNDAVEMLQGFDQLPDAATLLGALGGDLDDLVTIATTNPDPGVRLRAYRSLGLFDDDRARTGLLAAVDQYRSATAGIELLYLISSVEALGRIGGSTEVAALSPLLDASSRDLRVVVAEALGQTRVVEACPPLTARLVVESVDQVRIAIADAKSALGQICAQ